MVIVTTPALAAQKVAQRAADMARRSFVRVVGVIENMSRSPAITANGTSCSEQAAARRSPTIGVPLLGQVPLEAAVAQGGDAASGRPRRGR